MFKFNVRNNAYKLFVTFCVLSVIFLFFFTKKSKISIYSAKSYLEVFSSDYVEYKKNCIDLFKKKRNINSDLIFRPPLKKPPEELMDDFEQNGDMPITNYRYFNDAYLDSDSLNTKQSNEVITQQTLDDLVNKISKNESFNYYADEALKDLFLSSRYKANILDKTMAVFGTILIWVEAIAYKAGSSKIFTFDYTRKTYFDQNKFHWYHMLDYLDEAINGGFIENFDNAVSFSSFGNFIFFYCYYKNKFFRIFNLQSILA